MKSTLILATGALFCTAAHAQLLNRQKDHYCTITGLAAAETFFSNQGKGGLEVSFPYQVTNASGATADSVFHSRVIHPFNAVKVYIVHLGFDLGDRRQFAGVHFSPVLMGEGSTSNNPIRIAALPFPAAPRDRPIPIPPADTTRPLTRLRIPRAR